MDLPDAPIRPPRRLVVIGGSLAGLRAVEAARKAEFDGSLTLIGAEPHLPYDRPPLSKAVLEDQTAQRTTFRPEEVLRDELLVDLRLGTPATRLDTVGRRVLLGTEEIPYDALIIATGATPRSLPGSAALDGVHTLRTWEDAVAVRAALDAGARTVIVGAGFIGSEVASAARARDLPVTVVEAMPTPLSHVVGGISGRLCASLHHDHGTNLRCGARVAAVEGGPRVQRVLLDDGTSIDADLVVVGIGAEPATDWLNGSGLSLENGVVCDERLFTGVKGVYAAGDVARWHNPLYERLMRLEHWTSAAEQGAAAVRNALTPTAGNAYRTVPYFWSDWYGHRIQFVGIPATEEPLVDTASTRPAITPAIVLHREGDRLMGAFTLDGQSVVMKLRKLVAEQADWRSALALARGWLAVRARP